MYQERKYTWKIYQENLPKEPIHGIMTNHNTTKAILQTVSTQACKHDIINKKSPAFFYLLLSLFTATLSLKLQANWFVAINNEGFQYILFIPENFIEKTWINKLENGENTFNSFNNNNLFIYKMPYPPYFPYAILVNQATGAQSTLYPYVHQLQSNGVYPETVALCIDGSPCTLHKMHYCNNTNKFYIYIDKAINPNSQPLLKPLNYLMD